MTEADTYMILYRKFQELEAKSKELGKEMNRLWIKLSEQEKRAINQSLMDEQ